MHEAYRGGRVECFKVGKFDDINYIDINNLYGKATTLIDFPDLSKQEKIFFPLNIYSLKELLDTYGISRCLVINEKDDIGLLSVRTPNASTNFAIHQACPCGNATITNTSSAMKLHWQKYGNTSSTIRSNGNWIERTLQISGLISLREKVSVDWAHRDPARARMRVLFTMIKKPRIHGAFVDFSNAATNRFNRLKSPTQIKR